jgi:hypothetical protein
LERRVDDGWHEVVRFDHNPENLMGHDITEEGLHMDVYKFGEKARVKDDFPPVNLTERRATVSRTLSSTPIRYSGDSTNGTI